MAGLNKVIIIGNLGSAPELRYTQGGDPVCNFSVATSETWRDKSTNEKREKTEWHRIVMWGKIAETASKYLAKGSKVYLEGKLQTRSWEKDGQTHYATEILAKEMQFLSPQSNQPPQANQPKQPQQRSAPQQQQYPDPPMPNPMEDDIPF